MRWCLISLAIPCALLAVSTMIIRPQLRRPRLAVGPLLRGCMALMFLLIALALAAIALLAVP